MTWLAENVISNDMFFMDIYLTPYWLGVLAIIAALGVFVGIVFFHFWSFRLKKRYSPFTEDSLRLPGHTLREKHSDLSYDLLLHYIAYLFTAVGMVLAFLFLSSEIKTVVICMAAVFMVYLLRRVWCLLNSLRTMRLGREGEEYVGQELNLLMCRNAHVFHDIPYPYGNIDHIVVGKDKVFVVETKAVSKPQVLNKKGRRNSKVIFDGQKLIFPHTTTSQPIEQAQQHADYARKVLKKNCGVDIVVVPVVALPGWYVDTQTEKKGTLVINPKRGKALDHLLGATESKIIQNQVAVYFASVARSISARSVLTDPDASDKFDFWFNPKYEETTLA